MLSAAGHDVTLSWSLAEAHAEEADLIVADLDAEDARGAGRDRGAGARLLLARRRRDPARRRGRRGDW